MRQNRDLDTLQSMRDRLQQQTEKVKKHLKDNKYMSPKTANIVLTGTALAAAMGLAGAATLGLGAFTIAAGGAGAAITLAAGVKKIAIEREDAREGYSGFLAKSAYFGTELKDAYNKIREDNNSSPAFTADFIEYNHQLKEMAAIQQELTATQLQQERLAAQQRAEQRQEQGPSQEAGLSFG